MKLFGRKRFDWTPYTLRARPGAIGGCSGRDRRYGG